MNARKIASRTTAIVPAFRRYSTPKPIAQTTMPQTWNRPIEPRKFGLSVAVVPDRRLYSTAVFILAARADIPSEELRRRFPSQLKIGPVEKINELVNLQLPGVPVHPVPVAPRQIPFHTGFAYFELDQTSELWDQLTTAGGVGLHVAGEWPGLAMEFWAIRG